MSAAQTFQTTGHNPALLILTLVPLVGSLIIFALPQAEARLAKLLSLGFSLGTLIYTLVLLFNYDTKSDKRFQYFGSWTWIKDFGVHLAFGVDGIAIALLLMAVVLVPAVI